jgi:hypothetical protein
MAFVTQQHTLQGLQYALGPETLPWHFKWESLAY